jgi:hypothetical protein
LGDVTEAFEAPNPRSMQVKKKPLLVGTASLV